MPRRAVIDIGTNSVKLLIADVQDDRVEPLMERGIQTRLGSGFYETRLLTRKAIEETATAVACFAKEAQQREVEESRVIATSAAREALNAAELIKAVYEASGFVLDVISGEQEAQWAFEGVTVGGTFKDRPVLILDVGGGSSEFILGQGRQQFFRNSYPLGIVRALENVVCSDPPTIAERDHTLARVVDFLRAAVKPDLEKALQQISRQELAVVGTGGTACVLMATKLQLTGFDRERLENATITRGDLDQLLSRLWSLPLEERRKLPGLPLERADIILTGAAIYAGILDQFGFKGLQVSTRGLRFGAIAQPTSPGSQPAHE
jgi:exopolyphosphatase/guanosine-5'-triphosphate,3'-diphosphate pyrophosphatase